MHRLFSSSSFQSLLSHEKVGVLHQKRFFFLMSHFKHFFFSAFRCFLNENQRQLTPFQVVVAGCFQPHMCVRGSIMCLLPADMPARFAATAPNTVFFYSQGASTALTSCLQRPRNPSGSQNQKTSILHRGGENP